MSEETELIKERLDLAEVIGDHVQLKQAGTSFKGLCPFHQEKSPSFIVSPDKGIWHCFGCGEGGDVFSFVEKIENVDFVTALKQLAQRAGVELAASGERSMGARERLYDLCARAAQFYHHLLVSHEQGKKAREYLESRGVTMESILEFQLGYAPKSWDTLTRWLQKSGFQHHEMQSAGLVGLSKRGTLYDRFRGRIIWPIHDTQGRVVAFGGRIVPWHETGEEGKYINSPETPLYQKRNVVFNLNRAKKSLRHNSAIVVEGYMDVVMLHQLGYANCVASSGTAFTHEQVGHLSRFTKELLFAFDGDAAGIKAAMGATEIALMAGMRVRAVILPSGMDPADVALKQPDVLRHAIHNPESLVALLVQQMRQAGTSLDKEQAVQSLLPWLKRIANPIQQGVLVTDIADHLHVPEEVIIRQLQSISTPGVMASSTPTQSEVPVFGLEHYAIGLMILSPEARSVWWGQLIDTQILDEQLQMLYNSLQELAQQHTDYLSMSPHDVITALPVEYQAMAEGLRVHAAERTGSADIDILEESRVVVTRLQNESVRRQLRDSDLSLEEIGVLAQKLVSE